MHERPDWNRGDTLRSIKDFTIIGALAVKECVLDGAAWARKKIQEMDREQSA